MSIDEKNSKDIYESVEKRTNKDQFKAILDKYKKNLAEKKSKDK